MADDDPAPSAAGGRDETLATYETHADRYAERTSGGRSTLVAELTDLMAAGSRVLELGSSPGRDAADLERAGLVVDRTDGASSFVERLRRAGFDARVLNFYDTEFRGPDFGGLYDAVFANAVLLHAERDRLAGVLRVARQTIRVGGILAASFKKGDGDEWSTRKLDSPRHFTYWHEGELRGVLERSGWEPLSVAESTAGGSAERWITVTARHPGP